MKVPLRYQVSDYDCGPTSLLNAMSYLFEREEIPPEIVRNIMLYSLDSYGGDGKAGSNGTSRGAMMFLGSFFADVGKAGIMSIESRYISGKDVYIGQDSLINDTVVRGGAAVCRTFTDEWHYILITKAEKDRVFFFDPYFKTGEFDDENIQKITNEPFKYNRSVPGEYLNRNSQTLYSFGAPDRREAVLLFNSKTKITPDSSIEYII